MMMSGGATPNGGVNANAPVLLELVLFQCATMAGGILIQATQGYYDFEPWLYVRVVFGLQLADYVLIAALAMTVHVVVNHKYVGHMIVLVAIAFTRAAPMLGIRHNLLIYGGDPGWTYSDMNGFGPFIGPFVWFKLYWAAWALLLMVLAVTFLVRGRESGMRRRLSQARAPLAGPVARTAIVATALILVLGGFIFYNTNVLNEYRTADEQGEVQAEYEKRYGHYEAVPQPTLTAARLRIEIHPAAPARGRGRPRPRRRDHRHRRRPDCGHARRAATAMDGERARILPLCDRDAGLVRRHRLLRQV
ncbi:hypothetical protein BH23GEM10_BH23GEM10_06610 [soil metagenome]